MMNFLYDKQQDIDKALKWLYLHEQLIDKSLRAQDMSVYKFLSRTNPLVMGAQQSISSRIHVSINYNIICSTILGISLYALSKINQQGLSTASTILMLQGSGKSIYVIRMITDTKHQHKGIAKQLKKYFISHVTLEGYKSIWGHHEQDSIMQHINLKLGAEEIMTEPPGWNGSDKTHILYRITL